ncbi:hypothetical protein ABZP36_006950 [Zizania latifolia]
MAHPCIGDHGSYDLALRWKLSLLLDILHILRFVVAALLDRLGVVSCQDNELPGEYWGQHHVDTAAMESLMGAALCRTPWYRRRRPGDSPGGDKKAAGAEDYGSAAICTICLSALEVEGGSNTDQVAELSNCSHAFHAACIHGWVCEAGTCPLCRTTVQHTVWDDGWQEPGATLAT